VKALVTDALWDRLEPLIPPAPPRRFRFPGRKPIDHRNILTGILFVLKTGIAWDDLPAELGCGCGKTCRHYLRLWHAAGVWRRLHAVTVATQVFQVLTDMPAVGGKPGPKRQRPRRLQGDRGYDSEPVRQLLRWLGITPVLAARNTEHGSGLGVFRWVVERTISWLHAFGRLRRRLDRQTEIQQAFLQLACGVICLRFF
jgi:transposase